MALELPSTPLKSTPLALIEAAELLFGQYGIDGVSLRQIRLKAEVGNNSAVTYHFSDREQLVRAIWAYRLPSLDKVRRRLIDDIYNTGRERDAGAVLSALVMPNYSIVSDQGLHTYTAFVRHALRWKQGTIIRSAALRETPASEEALDLYYALRPDIAPEILQYRLRHATCMFFDMVFERDTAIISGEPGSSEQVFLSESMAMLESVCLRPAAG